MIQGRVQGGFVFTDGCHILVFYLQAQGCHIHIEVKAYRHPGVLVHLGIQLTNFPVHHGMMHGQIGRVNVPEQISNVDIPRKHIISFDFRDYHDLVDRSPLVFKYAVKSEVIHLQGAFANG